MDRFPSLRNLFPLLLFLSATTVVSGRDGPGAGIAARLEAAETARCWEWMLVLRSCAGEIILFFLNGEAYLGPSCCRAIRAVESQCWAAEVLLTALGFTAQEGDVLRGYCDATAAAETPLVSTISAAGEPDVQRHN